MAWLTSEGQVLASLEVASGVRDRTRGLLGRDGIEGALLLERTRWVHTLGMRFAIDVAHLDADRRVVRVCRMRPHRLGRPVLHARSVVEAEAGSFARWGLEPGSIVDIRD
ncbi:MAG: DUF192 domain-containing protein [Acidimicrobiales bacterium]|nr:DUF192 domain-containing protein [Acidimicrobiales bacterium]